MKTITTFTDPKLQDAVVQELNTALLANATLAPYIEHIFGIVHTGYDEENNSYPSVYYNDGSRKNMMLFPDNKVKSFGFWEFDGADVLDDDDGFNYSLTFLFWGNLERLNDGKNYDFTSEIEQMVIKILSDNGATDVSYTQDDVFGGYSKYQENKKQTLMRPNTGFKIGMDIHSFIC